MKLSKVNKVQSMLLSMWKNAVMFRVNVQNVLCQLQRRLSVACAVHWSCGQSLPGPDGPIPPRHAGTALPRLWSGGASTRDVVSRPWSWDALKTYKMVLVLKYKSWSWRKSLGLGEKVSIFSRPWWMIKITHLIIRNTSLFQHFVLLWQSSNPSCSAAINEWHKREKNVENGC